jgi:acyl-CoA synthetase (AMP-forming)/AMP-acid ligase II
MIIRSPYPAIEIPNVSLPSLILRRAEQLGNRPALIDGLTGQTVTYKEFAQKVRSVASNLAKRGFRKGDVFVILSLNSPEYAIALHAASILGGVVTTANPLYTPEELEFQLKDSNAKYIYTSKQFAEKAIEVANRSEVKEIFVLGDNPGTTSFTSLYEHAGSVPDVEIDPFKDTAFLPYSSGTTGLPKGVMLTHSNIVSNLFQLEAVKPYGEQDRLVCTVPFFHIYGLTVIMNEALYKGATIVLMPRFDLEQLLKVIQNYGITFAPLVPPIVLSLINDPIVKDYDLSKLRIIFSAAAPLDQNLSRACAERFNCVIKQGYGLTEASPATHTTPDEPERIKVGSVGPCMPNTEARIVDVASGKELDTNQEGEILIRGPQVMKGYLNREDATKLAIDEDGWLRTGDIGYVDSDGYFFIVDRVKELIKYKGYQVAPAELEAVLLQHPSVADAAVIPCPDAKAGEIPKAFVVLKEEATADQLKSFVAEHVAPYKKVRELEFIDQIPKSASGKILRRILIERERNRTRG